MRLAAESTAAIDADLAHQDEDVEDRDVQRDSDLEEPQPWREAEGARLRPMDLTLLSLDAPTDTRTFERGRFELYSVGPMTIGRATYEPGWRWSEHVGPATGETSCAVEHVGLVVSGRAVVKMDGGEERVMQPGDLFHVPPGHDSWVVGDEPYISLHVMGGEGYAASS